MQAAAILPLMLLTAVLNPLFNHRGLTILCWLPGGNPLTLEAIAYGIAAAGMLAAAISWFYCLNRVFTTDKFVWLFGRIIPFLSLLVSMTLRFVPQFTARARAVAGVPAGSAGPGGDEAPPAGPGTGCGCSPLWSPGRWRTPSIPPTA